jgi:hypothetical protein
MSYLISKRPGAFFAAAMINIYGLLFSAENISAKTIYVSPTGTSSGDGTSIEMGCDVATGLTKASAGDTVLLQGGTYKIPVVNSSTANTIKLSNAGTEDKFIRVLTENNRRAVLDFSYSDNSRYLDPDSSLMSYGIYFNTTAHYWYLKNIDITHTGYQGVYVTSGYVTFENCSFHDNFNSGLEVNKAGNNVTAINCDSYRNFDFHYKKGGMSDGFAFKETQGSNNKLIGCRAWENSDDGYDTYSSDQPVMFERCWSFRNGVNIWDYSAFDGNGNGFKVGGSKNKDVAQRNILRNCIAFANVVKGFDQNNNTGGITVYNCVSYSNGTNYGMGGTVSSGTHIVKNCISLSNKGTDAFYSTTVQAYNTWSSGFSVSTADFESIDTTLATITRNPDGTLPETKLFRLKSASKLINAGVDVGTTVTDGKPDIGAFEYEATTAVKSTKRSENKLFGFKQLFQKNQLLVFCNSTIDNANIKIFTVSGIKVRGASFKNSNTVLIDCSSLASGGYITELNINGLKQQMKFWK